MGKDKFYIGWKEEMPKSTASYLRKRVLFALVVIPVLGLMLVFAQNDFKLGQFQFGQLTEVTGVYSNSPVPMLLNAKVPGLDTQQDILLVGYGKFGAGGIMQKIEANNGLLNNKEVKLEGTLVTGGEKTVLELTAKSDAFKSIISEPNVLKSISNVAQSQILQGEILDPKCYFGTMKPGEGKIHKSCAIRCISGGIPPVFRTGQENYEYYILLDENGDSLSKDILEYVGEHIQLSGDILQIGTWKILYASKSSFIYL